MKTIDYTDYNGWGHALHGSTMREVKMPKHSLWKDLIQRIRDWKQKARYRSVMVHSMQYPLSGDKLKYEASRGIIEAEIVDVDPCRNPSDMFTLTFRVVP
jgi:hypothetical protein